MVVKGRSMVRTRTPTRTRTRNYLHAGFEYEYEYRQRLSTSTIASDTDCSWRMAVRNAVARMGKDGEKQKKTGWGTLISANQH